VYGDRGVLDRAAGLLGLHAAAERMELVAVSELALDAVPFGRVTRAGSTAMAQYIRRAVADVLAGRAAAIVTCPITKEGLRLAGEPFPGHTELLAAMCGGAEVVMMLAGDRLRVALVTTHVSLREAVGLITAERVERCIRITHRFFRERLGFAEPRIAVAGLNPHASEGGLFGEEEARAIAPAIAVCRTAGIDATGPHPADTVFVRGHRGQFDVVVAMTHDQGLGPLKLAHFDDAVNVTMGLPIIRTSVDHGTAYDIAGQGTASPTSLKAALLLAARMARLAR
jgi:4-hydroxythreonine-4-phosphate dehydrogenase